GREAAQVWEFKIGGTFLIGLYRYVESSSPPDPDGSPSKFPRGDEVFCWIVRHIAAALRSKPEPLLHQAEGSSAGFRFSLSEFFCKQNGIEPLIKSQGRDLVLLRFEWSV